jgi:hypothetical protein
MNKSFLKSVSLLTSPLILFPVLTKLWLYLASIRPDLALGYDFISKIYSVLFWLIYLVPLIFFIPVITTNIRSYKTSTNQKEKVISLIFITLGVSFSIIYLLSLTL